MERMQPYYNRLRRDRLSDLPYRYILRIFSFLKIKQVVQTSALSRKWRLRWTIMPCLSFSCKEFDTSTEFSEFVKHFLSRRDDDIQVFSVDLTCCRKIVTEDILHHILTYANSHNIQQLNITSFNEETFLLDLSLLCSDSLTHLTLDGCEYTGYLPSWHLPALETLNLYHFNTKHVVDDCFFLRAFPKLKNLTLKNCRLLCPTGLVFHQPLLSNATFEEGFESRYTDVVLAAPRLENLTIRNWPNMCLSTPKLSSLQYIHYDNRIQEAHDSNDDFYEAVVSPLDDLARLDNLNLKKVDICIDRPTMTEKDKRLLIRVLEQLLPPVTHLTLNLELVELLTPFVKSAPRIPFVNLETATVYPLNIFTPVKDGKKLELQNRKVADRFQIYLLDGPAHSAKLSEDIHEETIAMNNLTLARNLIQKLEVEFKKWGEEIGAETNLKQGQTTQPVTYASLFSMIKTALASVPPSPYSTHDDATIAMNNVILAWNLIQELEVVFKNWGEKLGAETNLKQGQTTQLMTLMQSHRYATSLFPMIKTALTRVPPSPLTARLQAEYSGLSAKGLPD